MLVSYNTTWELGHMGWIDNDKNDKYQLLQLQSEDCSSYTHFLSSLLQFVYMNQFVYIQFVYMSESIFIL